MSNETNSEEADKQEKLDTPEEKTEEVPVMEESPKLITESDALLNDEQEDKNVDFGTDGEYLPAAEEPDKEATNETAPNNLTISEFGEQPNDEQQHEGSDDFGFYEDFFKDFAGKHDLKYTRDEENPDFEIFLKADENTTHIQIDHGRNLTMTAKDKDNETVVPDQKMFNAIAELAKEKYLSITFGNIESDEYAARLYIACQNQQPPIKMIGAPNIDSLKELTLDTKKELENIKAKQETENQQNQTTDKATTDNQEEPHNNAAPNSAQKVDSTEDVTDKTEKSSDYTNTLTSDQTQKDITNKIQNLKANLKLPAELKNTNKSTTRRMSPLFYQHQKLR